jgi:hypothetical protein
MDRRNARSRLRFNGNSRPPGMLVVRHVTMRLARAPVDHEGERTMDFSSLVRWFSGKSQQTCPRCGGPMTATKGRRRWSPATLTCPQCDLRARWADSPGRKRI